MPKILVIEDEPSIIEVIREVLEEQGHEVVAEVGSDALVTAESGGVSLVILDLMLPLLSGGVIASYLHEHPATQRLPIVVISALEGVTDSLQALGVRWYLKKPFSLADLVAVVTKALYEAKCAPLG